MRNLSFSLVFLALLLLVGPVLGAQSNQQIDDLLSQTVVRLDSASYIVMSASGRVAETASTQDAFEAIKALGVLAGRTDPSSPLNVEELSFLLMKAFDLKAGVMYALFPGPRYAYRSMAGLKVVIDAGGPYRLVSGEEVIRSLRYAMELKAGVQ